MPSQTMFIWKAILIFKMPSAFFQSHPISFHVDLEPTTDLLPHGKMLASSINKIPITLLLFTPVNSLTIGLSLYLLHAC